MTINITNHALKRFRERVQANAGRSDMMQCLKTAKEKHCKALHAGRKNTLIVKTGCCFFICSGNRVVSVVKEMRARKTAEVSSMS